MKIQEILMSQPSRKVAFILFLGLFALAFTLGRMGIDFGEHWDERKLVKTVTRTYEEAII